MVCHLNEQTLTRPQLIKRIRLLIDLRIRPPELTLFSHTPLLCYRTNNTHTQPPFKTISNHKNKSLSFHKAKKEKIRNRSSTP